MKNERGDVFWTKSRRRAESLIGYVQVFSEKTETTLKSSALAACSMDVVVINVAGIVLLWRIENYLNLVGFLHVTMERYEEIEASGTNATRSALCRIIETDEMGAETSWKKLVIQLHRQCK